MAGVGTSIVAETKQEFLKGFASLFNSKRYSDVTLFLGPTEVKFLAHYAVLGVRTSYFDKAKEHGFKEGETNEYRFPDYSAHALWRVLQYFYTGDYSAEPDQMGDCDGGDDDFELAKHPRVYAIADLLGLEGLKKLCVARFESQLEQHWISDTFCNAVREVYATTYSNDRAMRDPIVRISQMYLEDLHSRPDFVKLSKEIAEFSGDLVTEILAQRTEP